MEVKIISDNWVVRNLENAIGTWNEKLAELWQLVSQSPESFRGGEIWGVIVNIHTALVGVGYGLLVLFFAPVWLDCDCGCGHLTTTGNII